MLKKLFSVFAAMVFAAVTLPAAEARLRPVGPEHSKLELQPAGGYSRIETVDGRSVLVTDVPKRPDTTGSSGSST